MKKHEIRFCGSFDMIARNSDKVRQRALEKLDKRLVGHLGRSTDEYTIVDITEI